jgi:hypothetical protein
VWRRLHIVGLSTIPGDAINADFNFGRISEMRLLQVLGADVERCEFGVRRCRAKTALFHIFDFIIGYQMLGNAVDGQGKSLRGTLVSFGKCMASTKRKRVGVWCFKQ